LFILILINYCQLTLLQYVSVDVPKNINSDVKVDVSKNIIKNFKYFDVCWRGMPRHFSSKSMSDSKGVHVIRHVMDEKCSYVVCPPKKMTWHVASQTLTSILTCVKLCVFLDDAALDPRSWLRFWLVCFDGFFYISQPTSPPSLWMSMWTFFHR